MTIICRLVIENHVPHVIAGVSPVLVHECGRSFEAIINITPPGDMHVWACSEFLQIPNHFASAVIIILHEFMHTQHTHTHTHTYTHCVQVPVSWLKEWEGPEEPAHYLRSLVGKTLTLGIWEERGREDRLLQDTLDLSELFHLIYMFPSV